MKGFWWLAGDLLISLIFVLIGIGIGIAILIGAWRLALGI